MRAQRLFPIALSLVLSILMMACKDSPTSPTPTAPNPETLKGTWLQESEDGVNVVDDGTIWTFDNGTTRLTDAKTGCAVAYTYTATSTTITATLTQSSCPGGTVGSVVTNTWSISNGKLTLKNSDGTTRVLRRISGNDRVVGTWIVTKVDGQPLAAGAAMTVYIYGNLFEIAKLKAGATESCLTQFSMTNTGTRLNVQVIGDECGDVDPGVTDAFAWSVNGNTIVLDLVSGGLKLEAIRL